MKKKKLKLWIKGAIIGFLIGFIYNLVLVITSIITINNPSRGAIFQIIFFPLLFLVNLYCGFFPSCSGDICSCNVYIPIIIFIFLSTLIGALIGLIVGKLRIDR